jgi:cytoskeleton protein RodZ
MNDAEALGNDLREARQAKDMSLEQAEQRTRIRIRYLEALEQGNYSALPSPVQTRGFLRNYARFLGLDAEMMSSRYDIALQGGRRRNRRNEAAHAPVIPPPQPAPPPIRRAANVPPAPTESGSAAAPSATAEKAERRPRPSWVRTLVLGLISLVLLAIVLIVGLQGVQSLLAQNRPGGVILSPLPRDASPTDVPTVSEFTATSALPTSLPNPNEVTGASSDPDMVAIKLQIRERTWLRVIVDDSVSYMGQAAPNTVLQYQGKKINVRIANGVGVHAVVNGMDLGVLGARGQIVDQTYTARGQIAASPSPPPQNAPDAPQSTQSSSTSPQATYSLTAPTDRINLVDLTVRPRVVASNTVLPTFPPTATFTVTATFTPTSTVTLTPSITLTPSQTHTPTTTFTPSNTYTPTLTLTPTITPLYLPRDTSTPPPGDIRPK